MKFFVRFLLLLCFVALGRHSFLFAHAVHSNAITTVHQAQPGAEGYVWLKAIEVEEDDEDKHPLSKKHPVPGTGVAAFFARHSYGFHLSGVDSRVPFGRYIFYSSPQRYIMYQVFRV